MQGIVTFVGDLRFALFALTGGDEYYTVGGAATIDGCGRCIFQYFLETMSAGLMELSTLLLLVLLPEMATPSIT